MTRLPFLTMLALAVTASACTKKPEAPPTPKVSAPIAVTRAVPAADDLPAHR